MADPSVPPPHPPPDQMEVVQTKWGPMERWRAVALCIGEISRVVDDAAAAKQPLTDEDKPPPLAADTIADAERRQYHADLYKRCDTFERRVDILAAKDKAKKAAHAALLAAEAAFTAQEDDCDDMTMGGRAGPGGSLFQGLDLRSAPAAPGRAQNRHRFPLRLLSRPHLLWPQQLYAAPGSCGFERRAGARGCRDQPPPPPAGH